MLNNNKQLKTKGLQISSPTSMSTKFVDGFNEVSRKEGVAIWQI
jgi:hypothetical protein